MEKIKPNGAIRVPRYILRDASIPLDAKAYYCFSLCEMQLKTEQELQILGIKDEETLGKYKNELKKRGLYYSQQIKKNGRYAEKINFVITNKDEIEKFRLMFEKKEKLPDPENYSTVKSKDDIGTVFEGGKNGGWGKVQTVAMTDPTVPLKVKGLYCFIAIHVNKDTGYAFPSYATIQKELGIGSKKTVEKYLKILKDKGYIQIEQRKKANGQYDKNYYYIVDLERQQTYATKENLQLPIIYAVPEKTVSEKVNHNTKKINNNNIKDIKDPYINFSGTVENKKDISNFTMGTILVGLVKNELQVKEPMKMDVQEAIEIREKAYHDEENRIKTDRWQILATLTTEQLERLTIQAIEELIANGFTRFKDKIKPFSPLMESLLKDKIVELYKRGGGQAA